MNFKQKHSKIHWNCSMFVRWKPNAFIRCVVPLLCSPFHSIDKQTCCRRTCEDNYFSFSSSSFFSLEFSFLCNFVREQKKRINKHQTKRMISIIYGYAIVLWVSILVGDACWFNILILILILYIYCDDSIVSKLIFCSIDSRFEKSWIIFSDFMEVHHDNGFGFLFAWRRRCRHILARASLNHFNNNCIPSSEFWQQLFRFTNGFGRHVSVPVSVPVYVIQWMG